MDTSSGNTQQQQQTTLVEDQVRITPCDQIEITNHGGITQTILWGFKFLLEFEITSQSQF